MYIGSNGERSSSETGYLTPEVLARPNLRVVTGAHVTKLVFEESHDSSASAGGKRIAAVEFADRDGKDTRHVVRVRKEAILS